MGKKASMGLAEEPKKNDDGGPDDYEAKSALDDIMRAEEHKGKPDLMKRVQKHAGRKMKALSGIQPMKSLKDVRAHYDKKFGSGRKNKSMVMDDDMDGE